MWIWRMGGGTRRTRGQADIPFTAGLLRLRLRKNGVCGRIRIYTGDALDVLLLLLDYASKEVWGLPPVLPRRGFFAKDACGRPQGSETVAVGRL